MNDIRILTDEPMFRGGKGYIQKVIGDTDNIGFFSFNPAVSRKSASAGRCDDGLKWGPMSFHKVTDGSCDCGNIDVDPSTEHLCSLGYAPLEAISYSMPILTEPPVGYMCYQELADQTLEDLYCQHHWNCNARTLQEIFKLMYEWSDCHTLLGNSDPIAVVAHDLLEVLEVPQEVQDWVRSEMPDGPVIRFLSGDTNARERPSNIPDLPDFFSHWLWQRLDEIFAYGQFNNKNI